MISFLELLNAYYDCRRRKRTTPRASYFEIDYERNLMRLLDEINTQTYVPEAMLTFVVKEPSPREVWASCFRDRIIHHLIYNRISRNIEKQFIEDTYSCIKNRGTLAAWRRVVNMCRRESNNWDKPIYYLKMDIWNYFVSIDRNILWDTVRENLDERGLEIEWLIKQNIMLDPTEKCIVKTPELRVLIPPHKSLWNAPQDKGLPIGNLTSQFYSNVYLNTLDHYAKHVLKCRNYVRYVDDIVVISKDRDFLEEVFIKYAEKLGELCDMKLNPNKSRIRNIKAGLDFLGVRILPWRTYTLKRNIHKALAAEKREAMISYLGLLMYTSAEKYCKTLSNRIKTMDYFC